MKRKMIYVALFATMSLVAGGCQKETMENLSGRPTDGKKLGEKPIYKVHEKRDAVSNLREMPVSLKEYTVSSKCGASLKENK